MSFGLGSSRGACAAASEVSQVTIPSAPGAQGTAAAVSRSPSEPYSRIVASRAVRRLEARRTASHAARAHACSGLFEIRGEGPCHETECGCSDPSRPRQRLSPGWRPRRPPHTAQPVPSTKKPWRAASKERKRRLHARSSVTAFERPTTARAARSSTSAAARTCPTGRRTRVCEARAEK